MQRVAHHQFLYQRGGSYYFRRAIPPEARPAFGGRSEHTKSLRTKSLPEARLKAGRELEMFERTMGKVRSVSEPAVLQVIEPTREDMEAAARRWLKDRLKPLALNFSPDRPLLDPDAETAFRHLDASVGRDFMQGRPSLQTEWIAEEVARTNGWTVQRTSPLWLQLCQLIARGQMEYAKQGPGYLNGTEGEAFNKALFGEERYAQDAVGGGQSRLTLKQAVDQFLTNPDLTANAQTRAHYRAMLETMIEALGPHRQVAAVTRADCRLLRDDVILKLPNYRKTKLRGLNVRQAIAAADARSLPRIHQRTQNQMVDILHALFAWAVKYEHRMDNPAGNLRVKVPESERRPFTAPELRLIFNAPLYTGCKDDGVNYRQPGPSRPRGARFWIPLIGLFTGMRIREICQLRRKDFVEVEGVWAFLVQPDKEAGTRLKNSASRRRVPVHPELIRLGLLDRLAGLGVEDWLFPELRTHKDGADGMSKWFGRFMESVGLSDPNIVFHSFRHTLRDALRDSGVDDGRALALGGWTDQLVGNRYGKGYSLASLAEAMGMVRHVGLDLSHLDSA